MSNLQPHIRLDESVNAKYALLPGDPARLDRIAPFLTDVKELAYNREYRSLSGRFEGVPVLAVSTGIGGASAGIAVEELHAIGVSAMIRIGSCGALQRRVRVGELIFVSGAVRDDGASKTYVDPVYPAVPDTELLMCCIEAAKQEGVAYHTGIARSHDSFYVDHEAETNAFWTKCGVLGSDMETAALFTIGRLRGVRTASILNNVVAFEDDTADSIAQYADGESASMRGERNEIRTALRAFVLLDRAQRA